MKIRVDNLKTKVTLFEKLIEKYETNYLNFYNEIKECSINWKDITADTFFSNTDIEKKDTKIFYNELFSLKKIYNLIINEYENYGNDLYFELNDDIFTSFDNYNYQIDVVINKYKDMDSSFDIEVHNFLENHKKNLINNKNKLQEVKETYKDIYNKTTNSEEKIKNQLINFEINKISEVSPTYSKVSTNNNFYMEIEKIDSSIKKLKFYIQEEDLIYEDLNELFEIKYYNSKNSNKLEEIILALLNKYKLISTIHKNNIKILIDNNNKYFDTKQTLKNIEW